MTEAVKVFNRSEFFKKLWQDPEYRAHQIKNIREIANRPEVRAIHREIFNKPEVKAKRNKALSRPDVIAKRLKTLRSQEHRAKQRTKMKKVWEIPEHRINISEKIKIKWRNEEFIKKMKEGLEIKPNKSENKFIEIIKKYNLPYKYVGDLSVIIGGKNPDFINCNGQKKIIELFGNYWHNPKRKTHRKPKWHESEWGRKAVYSQFGYETLIIWDNELKNINKVLEKIKEFDSS